MGETGAGKTATIQHLAQAFKKRLRVVNLSRGTDSSDLFGGFRPMNLGLFFQILLDDYSSLLEQHELSSKNKHFFASLVNAFGQRKYQVIAKVVLKSLLGILNSKRLHPTDSVLRSLLRRTQWFLTHTLQLTSGTPMFDFAKGVLWKAFETGDWILLDEINLAQNEVLERLEQVLKSDRVFLLDSNQVRSVTRHPQFRLFAAMNPAHEVGKKALPRRLEKLLVRVEFAPVKDKTQVMAISQNYFRRFGQVTTDVIDRLAEFYCRIRVERAQWVISGILGAGPNGRFEQ